MERMQPLTDALFYVLLALRQPKHGYGIIQEVQELTNGRLVLGAGTLYGALKMLEERGWISLYSQQNDSRKKKEYLITEEGRKAFLLYGSKCMKIKNKGSLKAGSLKGGSRMKEKLVRWKFYFDKDKEEQWLNEMAAKGWSMKSFFAGRYTFEQTQPGEYLYQVELLPRNVKEKAEYLEEAESKVDMIT